MFRLYDKINNNEVYVIAEMSANHGGSLETALEIVRQAARAGADCVKIQTYTADTMTIDCDNEYFQIHGGLWDGYKLYDLYCDAGTPWEWQERIKQECESCGVDFLSTPFDNTSVDFLENLNVEAYKIASFELVDIPLIEYTASKGKPMIISCGMGSLEEIQEALDACYRMGNRNVVLLKCCSAYPAVWEDMHLGNIPDLKRRFDIPIGLSDHSLGSLGAIVGVSLGACVVEKHVCLSRQNKTPDSDFSMEMDEFAAMVRDIRNAKIISHGPDYSLTEHEKQSKIFKRSLFAVKDISAGENLTKENIRSVRPSDGLPPKHYNNLLGAKARTDIKRGTPLTFDMIERDRKAMSDNKAIRVLLLTNNENAMELRNRLTECGAEVITVTDKPDTELLERYMPDLVVSYNYNYLIKADFIAACKREILNLHISMLPWNRGTDPNFWSFYHNTPKGVTIHAINTGLDTGPIAWQKEFEFDASKETFRSTYNHLNQEIVNLFMEHWEQIKNNDIVFTPQDIGNGTSYHRHAELLELTRSNPINWDMNIQEYISILRKNG